MIMKFMGTALKNMFSKPATCNYPFEPAVFKERTRGHIEYDQALCIFCSLCALKCPSNAITVDRANSVWSINRFDCVQCGNCTVVCPKKALSIIPGYQEPGAEKFIDVHKKEKKEDESAGSGDTIKYPEQDAEKCIYCTLCAKKCPQSAIEVDRDEKTWKFDKEKCVSCGTCADTCPKKAIDMN